MLGKVKAEMSSDRGVVEPLSGRGYSKPKRSRSGSRSLGISREHLGGASSRENLGSVSRENLPGLGPRPPAGQAVARPAGGHTDAGVAATDLAIAAALSGSVVGKRELNKDNVSGARKSGGRKSGMSQGRVNAGGKSIERIKSGEFADEFQKSLKGSFGV